jgi:hypothetical protein
MAGRPALPRRGCRYLPARTASRWTRGTRGTRASPPAGSASPTTHWPRAQAAARGRQPCRRTGRGRRGGRCRGSRFRRLPGARRPARAAAPAKKVAARKAQARTVAVNQPAVGPAAGHDRPPAKRVRKVSATGGGARPPHGRDVGREAAGKAATAAAAATPAAAGAAARPDRSWSSPTAASTTWPSAGTSGRRRGRGPVQERGQPARATPPAGSASPDLRPPRVTYALQGGTAPAASGPAPAASGRVARRRDRHRQRLGAAPARPRGTGPRPAATPGVCPAACPDAVTITGRR